MNTVKYIATARAMHDFEAQSVGELPLSAGDIVNVEEKNTTTGWWLGQCKGKRGYFSGAFVEIVESTEVGSGNEGNKPPVLPPRINSSSGLTGSQNGQVNAVLGNAQSGHGNVLTSSGNNVIITTTPAQVNTGLGNSTGGTVQSSNPIPVNSTGVAVTVAQSYPANRTSTEITTPENPNPEEDPSNFRYSKSLPSPPPRGLSYSNLKVSSSGVPVLPPPPTSLPPPLPTSAGNSTKLTSPKSAAKPVPPPKVQPGKKPSPKPKLGLPQKPTVDPIEFRREPRRCTKDFSFPLKQQFGTSTVHILGQTSNPSAEQALKKIELEPGDELDKRRYFIAKEILDTELTYVKALTTAVNSYYIPMITASKTDVNVPAEAVKTIFGNIETLLPINQDIAKRLQERLDNFDPAKTTIGDVFKQIAPFLKMYTIYGNNYDSAMDALDEAEHSTWLAQFTDKKLAIETLLITPIQRIPRYKLLFEDLLAHTAPTHPDYSHLTEALKIIREIADHVNSSMKKT